jgi:hypothetical protein
MMIAGLATVTNGRLIIILLLHSLVISLVNPSHISLLHLTPRFSDPFSDTVLEPYGHGSKYVTSHLHPSSMDHFASPITVITQEEDWWWTCLNRTRGTRRHAQLEVVVGKTTSRAG